MTWQIRSTSVIALGNGTRERGFLFGCIETEEAYQQAIEAALAGDHELLSSLVQPEEGVLLEEIANALRTQYAGGSIQVDSSSQSHANHTVEDEPSDEALEAITLEDLDIPPSAEQALREAGLLNALQIANFASHNDDQGLVVLEGIGKATEAKIKAAIASALGR